MGHIGCKLTILTKDAFLPHRIAHGKLGSLSSCAHFLTFYNRVDSQEPREIIQMVASRLMSINTPDCLFSLCKHRWSHQQKEEQQWLNAVCCNHGHAYFVVLAIASRTRRLDIVMILNALRPYPADLLSSKRKIRPAFSIETFRSMLVLDSSLFFEVLTFHTISSETRVFTFISSWWSSGGCIGWYRCSW